MAEGLRFIARGLCACASAGEDGEGAGEGGAGEGGLGEGGEEGGSGYGPAELGPGATAWGKARGDLWSIAYDALACGFGPVALEGRYAT